MGIRGGQLRILTSDELCEIHLATLEILERVGVKVSEQKALRMLGEAGAHIDVKEKIARIPEYLVEDAIKKAPSGFTLFGRDSKYKLRLQDRRVYFSMGGQSVNVLDLETGKRRASTLKDCEDFCRLADALENIHHASSSVVRPRDVPDSVAHVYELLAGFRNTTKTVDGEIYGQDVAMDSIRMASVVAGGEEELKKRPLLLGFHNPVSPLQLSEKLMEGLMVYAKYKQPILIAPEAQAGATAPVTLAGLLAQQNAEVLSGIVVAELVNPGAPVLYGTVSTIMDMKTGNLAYGAIEAGLINVVTGQLAHYYGLPSRGTGGGTESKIPDIQAGFEKAMTLMMAALAGINFIYNAAGTLESTLTASYEQAVIDNEICGMVSRALRGVEISDETLAIDVIEDVGPGGQYLDQRHTLEYLKREHYLPKIINRERMERWERAGSKDLREVAREEAKRILKEHRPEPLDRGVEEDLKKIVKEVEKRESERVG
ncbi:MAG: trimethylamine methyltransferase family protein [Candidatus Bathyarchaeota archaeon]|nr:trimethylamine methyltransferase family protein [Candidatus Bathyarchaeota archaeon]MDH5713006.1 trimethylamine methyltransferase family protein [Candidatus Bathyarchaeota archaeon]